MDNTAMQRVVRENRPLFLRMHQFNCRPATWVHPEHLTEWISADLLQRLRTSRRGERKLSLWIAARWEFDAGGVWDFDRESQRLALLNYDTLDRLMSLTGAAVYHRRIALAVDRATQGRLKQSLGNDYLFAVKRAPFLVKEAPERLSRPLGEDPATQLREAGTACLAACLAGGSPGLFQRLALKLPPRRTLGTDTILSDGERLSVWGIVKRILLSEINPGLAPCFN